MARFLFLVTIRSSMCLAAAMILGASAWSAAAATMGNFDGTYVGVSAPELAAFGCGNASRSIYIKVKGYRIQTKHYHPHHQ